MSPGYIKSLLQIEEDSDTVLPCDKAVVCNILCVDHLIGGCSDISSEVLDMYHFSGVNLLFPYSTLPETSKLLSVFLTYFDFIFSIIYLCVNLHWLGQIAFLQNVECKLKEVCKQRDELKKQIEEICSSKPTGGGVAEDIKRLKILECQKKEIEKERNSLRCKLEKLECKSIEKDNEINKLTTKANKLQEAILCLEVSPGKNRNCNTVKCCNNNNNDDVIPKHSSSDTCFKDLKCIQDNLHSLQKKVTQQEKVIDSQNKCLQEQHCYILEQEELRVALRNKVKELTEQQIQLLHERNNLSSEIRSLTVKLGRSISFAEVSSQPCE
ncbi:uncharacterized protein LOC142319907 [Lycorma delicatula]|uniref:uncharacterized protein LOC142319907 n=1 Tax=Lycorma delicatula TaxID=130591 RepID=UPI003F50DF17